MGTPLTSNWQIHFKNWFQEPQQESEEARKEEVPVAEQHVPKLQEPQVGHPALLVTTHQNLWVLLLSSTSCIYFCFQSNVQHKSFPESLVHPAQAIQVRFLLFRRCASPPPPPSTCCHAQTWPNLRSDSTAGRTPTTATRARAAARAGDAAGGGATATGARSADLGETPTLPRPRLLLRPDEAHFNSEPFFFDFPQVLPLLQPQLLQGQKSQSQQSLQLSLYLLKESLLKRNKRRAITFCVTPGVRPGWVSCETLSSLFLSFMNIYIYVLYTYMALEELNVCMRCRIDGTS